MISRLHDAHHLWRQGHQTFSGFIKSRERPGKKGEKDFGRIEPKIIGGTKAENVSTPEAEKTQKNRAINPEKLEPKQKQKPRSKEIIHREKERKGIQYTQRIVPLLPSSLQTSLHKKTQHKTQIPNWKEKPAPSSIHHHKD
jgi:hypothetical protein